MEKSKVRLEFEVGSRTTPGTKHEWQDRLLVDKERLLFAIADGVTLSWPNGSNGGLAAEIALSRLRRNPHADTDLARAIAELNDGIVQMRMYDGKIGETTITAAKITGNILRLVNVGDSPAHVIRGDRMRRLHTPDIGPLGGLNSCIGFEGGDFAVHQKTLRILPGDLIMIASDGITKRILSYIWNSSTGATGNTTLPILTTREIKGIVGTSTTLDDAASEMFGLASRKRPDIDDDKTIILIKASMRE